LLGEIDLDKDDYIPEGFEKADIETVHKLAKEDRAKKAKKEKARQKKLFNLGFEGEAEIVI
jgi:U6 snRNA-associated Sm-like protein LSm1